MITHLSVLAPYLRTTMCHRIASAMYICLRIASPPHSACRFKSQEVADMKYGQPLTRLMIKAKEAGPGRDFVGALREAVSEPALQGTPELCRSCRELLPSLTRIH